MIETGSNYTVFAGVLFLISINFIYRDWHNSVLENIKRRQGGESHFYAKESKEDFMRRIKERVSFSGIYNLHDKIEKIQE
jgi:hypothetical protein